MFKLVLETSRVTRGQIANIRWIIEKARNFQKNICFIGNAKAFDCVDHSELWEILQEMGISDHLTCLLRNLYAGKEATCIAGDTGSISGSGRFPGEGLDYPLQYSWAFLGSAGKESTCNVG